MIVRSRTDFFGKKILIMGLGLHGGGVAAAHWFFRHGAEVIVTDTKNRKELALSIAKLTALCNEYRLGHSGKRLHSIEYVLGKHREDDVVRSDIVIQNAGVPRESLFLAIARARGIPIHNDASIFFSLIRQSPIIGVTGTRGKTTTVSLIAEILKKKYSRALALGMATPSGAVSFFSGIDRIAEDERMGAHAPTVLELSSWQLEILGEHGLSPRCAVLTNITPDHLNRYGSMDEYCDAKKNIFRFQNPDIKGTFAVLNADDPRVRQCASAVADARSAYWFSASGAPPSQGCTIEKKEKKRMLVWYAGNTRVEICDLKTLAIPGTHNEKNALAAATVGMLYGVGPADICAALQSFRGVAGRLENIGEYKGRIFYNDTAATSPEAACAALETLSGRAKKIVLIAGGADKNLVFDDLGVAISMYVKALVLLSGTSSPRIASASAAAGYAGPLDMANSMEEAVQKAWKQSTKRDIILLSPASASFGMFSHEFDRGNQFIECAKALMATLSA